MQILERLVTVLFVWLLVGAGAAWVGLAASQTIN